jgi:hypothetical protein
MADPFATGGWPRCWGGRTFQSHDGQCGEQDHKTMQTIVLEGVFHSAPIYINSSSRPETTFCTPISSMEDENRDPVITLK